MDKGALIKKINDIVTPNVPVQAAVVDEQSVFIEILKKIPIIAGLFNNLKVGGESAYNLVTPDSNPNVSPLLPHIASTPVLGPVYQHLGLVSAAANVVTLPMVSLASWILGKPSPLTLTNFAQWLYSSFLMALMIAALVFPPAAPFIAITLIVLGFVTSVFFLVRFIQDQLKTTTELEQVGDQINALSETIEAYTRQLATLGEAAKLDCTKKELFNMDVAVDKLNLILTGLREQWVEKQNEKSHLEAEATLFSKASLMDKLVGLTLATLTVITLPLFMFFPVIGIPLLNTIGAVGAGYTIGRMASTMSLPLGKAVTSYLQPMENTAPAIRDIADATMNTPSSTASMLPGILPSGPSDSNPIRSDPPGQSGPVFSSENALSTAEAPSIDPPSASV